MVVDSLPQTVSDLSLKRPKLKCSIPSDVLLGFITQLYLLRKLSSSYFLTFTVFWMSGSYCWAALCKIVTIMWLLRDFHCNFVVCSLFLRSRLRLWRIPYSQVFRTDNQNLLCREFVLITPPFPLRWSVLRDIHDESNLIQKESFSTTKLTGNLPPDKLLHISYNISYFSNFSYVIVKRPK